MNKRTVPWLIATSILLVPLLPVRIQAATPVKRHGALSVEDGRLVDEKGKKLIDKNDLSWCAWNLNNKNESSSLLKASTKKKYGWKNSQLSKSGKWIRKWMKE